MLAIVQRTFGLRVALFVRAAVDYRRRGSGRPVTAKVLLDHLEAKGLRQGQISFEVLIALRPMITSREARRLLDEIADDEDEIIPDAEPILAREEHHDAVKLPIEPANPDTGHAPWLVWIPARKALPKAD